MKKFLLSLGLVAMMLNLTNCAQYEDVNTSVDVKGDFELYASISRTANNGLNTAWSANDALNVFHAVTDMTTYTNDGQFKLESGSADRFLGNLAGTLDVEEEYDWYVLYPYSSYVKTPANTGNGYLPVGAEAGKAQTQNGNNSMAHLAGSNYPLAGVAKAVGAGTAPTVAMKNLTSVLEFEVTNTLSEAITVSEITFTAPVIITGTYYINFVDMENVKFTSSGDNYVAKSATLKVSNGTAIEAGASAKFYLAVKPFTAEAGSELAVKVSALVNGNEFSYSKAINLTAATTFSAGKIKPIAIKYNVELPSAEEIIETIDFSKQGYANQTAITSFTGEYCNITFSKGTNSNAPKYYTTGSAIRCYGGNTFTIASTKSIVKVVFSFATGEGTNAITATPGTFATDTWTGSANSVAFTIGGSTGHRRIQKIQITYVDGGETPETPETPATPILSVNPTTLEFGAAAGSKTVACTIENEVEGVEVAATENVDWLTTSVSGKTVTITATENTGDARTATVTIAYEGADSETVTVNQLGAAAKVWTLVTDASTLKAGDQIIIAAKDYNYAISTEQKSNNRGQAAITKSGSTLSTPSSSVQIITLAAGKTSGTWAFNVGSLGYLYAASSSSNYLKSEKTLSANSSWNVTIASNGTATIKATGSNSRNVMQYNQSSSLFACYSSASQKAVAIYKLQ